MKRIISAFAASLIMMLSVSPVNASEDRIMSKSYNDGYISAYLKLSRNDMRVTDVTADGVKTELIDFRAADENDPVRTTVLADRSALSEESRNVFYGVLREILSASGENETFRLISFGSGGLRTHSDLTANQMRILDCAEKIQPESEQADLYGALESFQETFPEKHSGIYERLIVFTGSSTVNAAEASSAGNIPDTVPAYFIITDSGVFYDFNITSPGCSTGYCSAAGSTDFSKAASLASDMSDIYYLKAGLSDDIIGNGGEKRIGISLENSDVSLAFEETVDTGDHRYAASEKSLNSLKILVAVVTLIAAALASALVIVLRKKKTETASADSCSENIQHRTVPLEKKSRAIGTIFSGMSTRILFRENTHQKIILTETENPDHVIEISSEKETVIGRNQSMADVMIYNERSVSQRHCRIFSRNSRIYVEDLDSLNHTYVDGEEVTGEAEMFSGSVLKIGRVSFDVKITPLI